MAKKGYRVMFIGLPMFTKRTADNLSRFDPGNSYKNYNTYFSLKDRVRFLRDFRKADLVYSMTGSVLPSEIFKRVLKKGIPLVMHWMGTDVLKAINAKKVGLMLREYADYAHHVTEAPWLQQELIEVDIQAELLRYATTLVPENTPDWSKQFEVMTYHVD